MHRAPASRLVRPLALALVAMFAGDLCAQATSGPQHRPGRRSMCRFDDTLYLAAFTDAGEVTLWKRPEGQGAWSPVPITGGINDANSGITTNVPTNYAAMTATSDGVLHVAWGRASYPSFYEFYYRAIDPVAGVVVTDILNTTAYLGTTNGNRSDSVEIAAVDDFGGGQPAVYLTAQGTSSWVTRLLRIERTASGWPVSPAPLDLGNMSSSASSQRPRIVVGPDGTVHTSFYNNSGSGNWVYRAWNGSWGPQVILGLGAGRQDNTGDVSVDPQGVVHAVYNHWVTTTTSEVRYQQLIGGVWTPPVVAHTPAAGYSMDNRLAMTTDVFGNAFVAYYNVNDEAVYRAGSAGSFGPEQLLLPSGIVAPGWPIVTGSLFPVANRNFCELDFAYRWVATAPDQVLDQRVGTCTCATLNIGFGGAWATGSTGQVLLTGAAPNDFALCALGMDRLFTPLPALGCSCPIFVTPEVLVVQLVDAAGAAQVTVPMPALPLGTTLWAQWLTLDAGLGNCRNTEGAARYVP
ncbi:MAG: hypothetical protein R3F29_09275 [Planctomycetota bacterium]